jgi:hypothetical protein
MRTVPISTDDGILLDKNKISIMKGNRTILERWIEFKVE